LRVLSAAPQLPYGDDEARTAAAARYVNVEYAALVAAHPDRFRAFAATPMPRIDASIAEMSRAIDELGMVGLTMKTSIPLPAPGRQRGVFAAGQRTSHRRDAADHLRTPDTPEAPSQAVHRLWYDTVSHCHAPALRCAIDSFGADRLLLGTDFPYEDGDTFVRAVEYILDGTDPAEAHAILDANAMALFKLA
jgi:predicted TIM-barrel fold metal-dependent hydrolase